MDTVVISGVYSETAQSVCDQKYLARLRKSTGRTVVDRKNENFLDEKTTTYRNPYDGNEDAESALIRAGSLQTNLREKM